ncbi:hypothetical protein CEXT_1711 [Caerostris extrusa]|uniref:Uncharacterized protein n=1 Tax=Caerostris extrusa TaxID=172846 RepID=A0AAV4X2P5_CAEEX|nr:hypothetical protein CEXT_1711 [Caerostris extrusa]
MLLKFKTGQGIFKEYQEALCVRGISDSLLLGDYISGLDLQVEGWVGVNTSTPEKVLFTKSKKRNTRKSCGKQLEKGLRSWNGCTLYFSRVHCFEQKNWTNIIWTHLSYKK